MTTSVACMCGETYESGECCGVTIDRREDACIVYYVPAYLRETVRAAGTARGCRTSVLVHADHAADVVADLGEDASASVGRDAAKAGAEWDRVQSVQEPRKGEES